MILKEATFDLQIDVDWIYNEFCKSTIDAILNDEWDGHCPMSRISTKMLRSEDAIKAHALNPSHITINGFNGAAYYPRTNSISLGINRLALDFIKKYNRSLEDAMSVLSPSQKKSIKLDISPQTVKGTIYHELAHWVEDSNYRNVEMHLIRQQNTPYSKRKSDYNTPVEINAIIHQIVLLKNEFSTEWDNLTFREMLDKDRFLSTIEKYLKPEEYSKWCRTIATRMAREGLLGKNMRDIKL
jgi:hypothetical protein